jgi:hypothetical protein
MKKFNRRVFVKATTSAVFFWSLPYGTGFISCTKKNEKQQNTYLQTGILLAEVIFPDLGDLTPTINEIGFEHHLHFYLTDSNNDPDLQKKLIRRLKRFREFVEKNKLRFYEASLEEKSLLLSELIKRHSWIKNLISQLENIIFEALLLDPHYKINIRQTGWKWLNHPYGQPRPDSTADYEKLLRKRDLFEIIDGPDKI